MYCGFVCTVFGDAWHDLQAALPVCERHELKTASSNSNRSSLSVFAKERSSVTLQWTRLQLQDILSTTLTRTSSFDPAIAQTFTS